MKIENDPNGLYQAYKNYRENSEDLKKCDGCDVYHPIAIVHKFQNGMSFCPDCVVLEKREAMDNDDVEYVEEILEHERTLRIENNISNVRAVEL